MTIPQRSDRRKRDKKVFAAMAALNLTPGDYEGNLDINKRVFKAASNAGVRLLVCPEFSAISYGLQDEFLKPDVWEDAEDIVEELIPLSKGMVATVGVPLEHNGAIFNMVAILVDGELKLMIGKQNLAGDGIHYENRWFNPWPKGEVATINYAGQKDVPIGDLTFEIEDEGIVIGAEICEDAFCAERPSGTLINRGCNIIINPSASHFSFGKHELRKSLVSAGSRMGALYLYANFMGNESGRALYDGGLLAALNGECIAQSPRFKYTDFQLMYCLVNLDEAIAKKTATASHSPLVGTDPNRIICSLEGGLAPQSEIPEDFDWNDKPDAWEENEKFLKEEEFLRALCIGLFDYARKSRQQGFVVSLSGGCDSAVVAIACYMLVKLGIADIGAEDFVKRLGVSAIEGLSDPKQICGKILDTAYQATENSGDVTRTAASTLAAAIGARHHEWRVDGALEENRKNIEAAIGRKLNWDDDDIALQNIQARVRSPGIWMLTNVLGRLLLSTSNRSEAAVGYATMDGDTSGGLSPIAGIDKQFLREWLVWMEEIGTVQTDIDGTIPALSYVNTQDPTAELRPRTATQTDEEDLMPYPVLDVIERTFLVKRDSIEGVCDEVLRKFPQFSPENIGEFMRRFIRLWVVNQWKRERYAVSFHFDDYNLDPKTGCRMPILNGSIRRLTRRVNEWVEAA